MMEEAPPPKPILVILYGSQTGNSEAIAKDLHVKLSAFKDVAQVGLFCMKNFAKVSEPLYSVLVAVKIAANLSKVPLDQCDVGIFVTSSTGQGDPPDNALRFNRYLMKRDSHPANFLQKLNIAVLGSSFRFSP